MPRSYKLTRKPSTGEHVVRCWVDGKRHEAGDYYTNDKADAIATMRDLIQREIEELQRQLAQLSIDSRPVKSNRRDREEQDRNIDVLNRTRQAEDAQGDEHEPS